MIHSDTNKKLPTSACAQLRAKMTFGMVILFGVRNKINLNGITVKGTVAKSCEGDDCYITICHAINFNEQKFQ